MACHRPARGLPESQVFGEGGLCWWLCPETQEGGGPVTGPSTGLRCGQPRARTAGLSGLLAPSPCAGSVPLRDRLPSCREWTRWSFNVGRSVTRAAPHRPWASQGQGGSQSRAGTPLSVCWPAGSDGRHCAGGGLGPCWVSSPPWTLCIHGRCCRPNVHVLQMSSILSPQRDGVYRQGLGR